MNRSGVVPDQEEPRIPAPVLWVIYAVVIGVAVLCLMAAIVFMLSPPA